jgi:hypothetical protein
MGIDDPKRETIVEPGETPIPEFQPGQQPVTVPLEPAEPVRQPSREPVPA